MLSIIIPTLNEQEYLPRLLESIKKQDFPDYEIIVADAGSKDATVEIAKKYGASIVPGGLPGKARNNGARVAKGDILFFLDADTVLSEGFLRKMMGEFNRRKLGIAGFFLIPSPKRFWASLALNATYNAMIFLSEPFLAHAAMGILVKKNVFEKVGGFDEQITVAEDHDMARKAAKYEKFGVIKSVYIVFSDRRFKKEGWARLGIKYFLAGIYIICIGPIKSDIFNYKFDHYKDKK